MTRKQFKTIQNIAAFGLRGPSFSGRGAAKLVFGDKTEFKKITDGYIHVPTATLFVL